MQKTMKTYINAELPSCHLADTPASLIQRTDLADLRPCWALDDLPDRRIVGVGGVANEEQGARSSESADMLQCTSKGEHEQGTAQEIDDQTADRVCKKKVYAGSDARRREKREGKQVDCQSDDQGENHQLNHHKERELESVKLGGFRVSDAHLDNQGIDSQSPGHDFRQHARVIVRAGREGQQQQQREAVTCNNAGDSSAERVGTGNVRAS